MKSTEEKAKLYNEAIEKLRKFYRDYDTVSCLIDVKKELANLFPELKESEDERIRKEIVETLNYANEVGGILNDVKCREYIAWLEKQGEQKPAWNEEDEMHIRELESLVKQAWTTAEYKNDKDTIHKMGDLLFFLKTLKPQLKKNWNEEDETMFISLKTFLNDASCYSCTECVDKILSWLKYLIEKCAHKPSDKK